MLSPRTAILVYGRDVQLLETRRLILGLTGARVWATTDLSEFDQLASTVSIDLIILCHSLSMEDCGRALALATGRWPLIQTVVLTSGGRCCHSGGTAQVVETAQGPEKLLHIVSKLVDPGHVDDFHGSLTD